METRMAESFGAPLRERREAAGISMGALAKLVNYSKSYLSKLENDVKRPNATVARLCDDRLKADGALIEAERTAREQTEPSTELVALGRRQMLAGASSIIGIALVGGPRPVPRS